MDRLLIDYLPPFLRDVTEIKSIMDAQQPEIEAAWIALDLVLNNQFIETATAEGVSIWEKEYGIIPQATDTLDERKFRIRTKSYKQRPFTVPALRQQLQALCGDGNYSVALDAATYILYVQVALPAKSYVADVWDLMTKMVPSNIVINMTLMYNTHETLSAYSHEDLTVYTHNNLRTEVM